MGETEEIIMRESNTMMVSMMRLWKTTCLPEKMSKMAQMSDKART